MSEDFDTNWDIEKYKSQFESEEHWQLRRKFLVSHKDKYPEDKLVCLAQVFFNVELLGCKYVVSICTILLEYHSNRIFIDRYFLPDTPMKRWP